MDQQNIYLPCSCKGLMKIKSSFNWYCSLNELGWQNGRGESRRVPSMNCVQATNWWMSWTCLIAHDCSTIQNHTVLLVHTYTYTCVYTFTFCNNYYSYSNVCTYHLCHYNSTFPLLLHQDEIALRYNKRITSPSNILMPILFFEKKFFEKCDCINPKSNLAA